MPNSTHNPDLNAILKAVSRSFYLSIRVLPKMMQQPIGIAYLLARAADAIADTAELETTTRLNHLRDFQKLLSDTDRTQLQSIEQLVAHIDHEGERELLMQISHIILAHRNLPLADFKAVKDVVMTLTTGMEKDLSFFTANKEDKVQDIFALPDDSALDEYTYLVAGCVGSFWTELSILHTPALSHWQQSKMSLMGIQFGKALQLTNILRDIAKDAKLGRCYLPASDLAQHHLNSDMLFDPKNNKNLTPVISKWVRQADDHFDVAEAYLLSIPRNCLRLRLASLWPILIGLSTLRLIKQKENFLDIQCNVKVKRTWVYKMLMLSIPASFSNTMLRIWIKSLKDVASQ